EAGFRRWGRFASWPWTAQLALGLLMVGGLVVLGFHARPPTATKHATTRQARPQDPAGNPLDVVDLLRVAVAGHDCDALWRLLSTDTQAGARRRADGARSPLAGAG